jgi:hypothetical protein
LRTIILTGPKWSLIGATMYETNVSVGLTPYRYRRWPYITLGIDDSIIFQGILDDPQTLDVQQFLPEGHHVLWLHYQGKTNRDVGPTEQAIGINHIGFQGISTDRMVWSGVFEPDYPEPWYSQQTRSGSVPAKTLTDLKYLGFNGTYRLAFTVPVFRWIHELENLGWIFD